MYATQPSLGVRCTAALLVALLAGQSATPAFADQNTWGALKAQYGEMAGHPVESGSGTHPEPFPFAVTVEGDVDLTTAQDVLIQIGLDAFAGADVGVIATDRVSDWKFVIASFPDRVELYRYSLANGVENRALMYPVQDTGFLYSDSRGRRLEYVANDPALLPKVTACEVVIGIGGLAQCALIGLAGPWFGVACGVKWLVIGLLADC